MQKGKFVGLFLFFPFFWLTLFSVSPSAVGAQTLTSNQASLSNSAISWIGILIGGLLFLIAVMIGVIIYMLKMFKKKY